MISFYLNPTDSFAPRFYCQPKMHKPSTSINFVVWYTSSPLGTITKYIANILKAYVKDENNVVKNFSFSDYIRNVPIEDNKLMVPFEATNLYTIICLVDNWNIIKDYVNSNNQFIRKSLYLKTSWFSLPGFNNNMAHI